MKRHTHYSFRLMHNSYYYRANSQRLCFLALPLLLAATALLLLLLSPAATAVAEQE
jgi:hypothetical protein